MAELELHPHPEYQALADRARWLRLTLAGGHDYKTGEDDHGYETLPRYQTETPEAHVRRVAATPVPKIAAEYVRQRRDDVMRSKIVRPQLDEGGDAQLAEWARDVDQGGCSLSAFVGRQLHEGLVTGFAWYGVDAPRAEVLEGMTAADRGSLPWAVSVPLEDVIDWDIEGSDVVRVAIVYRRTSKASLTSKPVTTRYVVEWLPDVVRRYEVDEEATASGGKGSQRGVGALRLREPDESPHAFGFVPWMRFEPVEGEAFAARFAELQRSAMQTRSDMVAEQKANTYTKHVFWGVPPADLAKAAGDASNGLAFDNDAGHLDTVGGDPAVMQELRANLAADLDEARRRSELTGAVLERSSQPESGVALALRRSELASLRSAIAERTEDAENALIRMWAQVLGRDESAAEEMAASRYPRDFDGFAEDSRDERLESLRRDGSVPIEIRRAALREQVFRLWPQDSPERDELLEAVDTMQENAARRLLAGGGAPFGGQPPGPARPFGRPGEQVEAGA